MQVDGGCAGEADGMGERLADGVGDAGERRSAWAADSSRTVEDRSADEVAGGPPSGPGERARWRTVDRALRGCARRRAALDAEEARWLVEAERLEVHRRLGCGSIHEYLEQVLGYGPRVARDRLRVARALTRLPAMSGALERGELCHSAVRELTRVATPWTETAWIEAVRGRPLREVEQAVAGREPGDLPSDPADGPPRRSRLELELAPTTIALFWEARRRLEGELGEPLDDDRAVELMCQAVLDGPRPDSGEPGAAPPPHQLAVTVCDQCKRGWQDLGGRSTPQTAAETERAWCDAQLVGRADRDQPARATRTIPPAVRRLVFRRDRGRCIVPGCRASRHLEVHHVVQRASGGDHDPQRLALLCAGHHRAVHEGRLVITGEAPGFVIRRPLAAAHVGVDAADKPTIDRLARDVYAGLRRAGYPQAVSRRAVDEALAATAGDTGPPAVEALMISALRTLCPPPTA